MPAFVKDGPDIPESLLQAHEEGRVVFFCGAGISTPAGLPLFKGLVDNIYKTLGTSRNVVEEKAYEKEQYDAVIDQLERRYPGQRLAVRSAMAESLKPKLRRKGATIPHRALLQLATDRKGAVRLVTTNFDRIFQHVIRREKLNIPHLSAPLLPIPKPSRWHGVVYLHGLLPDASNESELNRLVLSSGDFGLAYLSERWAARFVSELFRYYVVCFVGYGINDPVMRYMMDALAADELLGEGRPDAYAFASFRDGELDDTLEEWQAKGVSPLLYKIPTGTHDHSALFRSLKEWADTYRDGVRGKEMIITQHAATPPLASSKSDFAVGRVLWALTDGLAAKHFADLDPVPPLEWLEPLSEMQFGHNDLVRFGVVPNDQVDDKLQLSVILRPSPYTHASWMSVADMRGRGSRWDDVMFHLARWLTRHLNDPKLILWLSRRGGQLHERFTSLIRGKIEDLDKWETNGQQEVIDKIIANAPKAVPGPFMRILWRFLLSGRLKSNAHEFDLYDWFRRFNQDGLTPTLRMELREILTPRISVREPFILDEELDEYGEIKHIRELVDWEVVLSCDYVYSTIKGEGNNIGWKDALPELLQEFTVLLRDVLDLKRELGGADDKSDMSYSDRPSISEHSQNKDYRDWTVLVDLLRDAWLSLLESNPDLATLAAKEWWYISYPLFRRLSFFAAANSDLISNREALDWLLSDHGWWLWSIETEREVLRLLVALGPRLNKDELKELQLGILKGPPRDMFVSDLDQGHWQRIVDREIWLRLAKLKHIDIVLNKSAGVLFDELCNRYPDWKLYPNEREEFPVWMGEGDEWREFVKAPDGHDELVDWLMQPSDDFWSDDDWRQRCRDDYLGAMNALRELAQKDKWPEKRWREALQAWAEGQLLEASWDDVTSVLADAPDTFMKEISHSLSWWLKKQAKIVDSQEELFFCLCRRLLMLDYDEEGDKGGDPVSRAINHPVGHVTQAILDLWYRQELKDKQGLSQEVKSLFTMICDDQVHKYRHGRLLLATHTIPLFRVDEEWASKYLLPLFSWKNSLIEARVAWEGFLWSPRLYLHLLSAIKEPFLDTVNYYDHLDAHAGQYADFLTFIALDQGDTFTQKELAITTSKLPIEGLLNAVQTLVRALEGTGEQRVEYWKNRILPYLKTIWPKSRDVMSSSISEQFGRLCIAAREAFPEAMEELRYWLKPVEHPGLIVNLLFKEGLCEKFPSDSLVFLDAVIGDSVISLPRGLAQCLDGIVSAGEHIAEDTRYIRLLELCQRHGCI